ncbi:heparinase II/III family protein [Primorskyibacter aestuariivivens]|uniref:heparinase II/III family protein n=1 Tax=Primorskyibacter aestuariivivens TaxID=1888912 RepID=UPI002300F2B7|nr:heparinase II/III family protein [Primorskyibacter aestuariivivens]MDA7429416.1 heparinase II/III family protein [Primorskyibacter aestuariivivens]
MSGNESWSARYTRLMHRVHARLTSRARAATGFVSQPEPRTIGSFNRGRQLIAGNLMFAGHLIEANDAMIWDLPAPDAAFVEQIHGFGWLDDLAAVGDANARAVAQKWLWGWIERYDNGSGPGWTPDLAGRRLIRWTHHALFLLMGREAAESEAFYKSLAHQTLFLGRRWPKAAPGLPRFEALTGLLYAGISLSGMEQFVGPAKSALARECARQIDEQGGIPTRNPEELLEVFTLLTWAAAALEETKNSVDDLHQQAIERIAPTLRALRHADGGLARFHGGGRGLDGRLDQALAASGVRNQADGLAMGFARLSAGRTSVIVDASAPPRGMASFNAHASTLAFELTSGRRPLIVNCGSGAAFGEDWRRAGRATPSHSTLALEGYSSARLGKEGLIGGARREMLEDAPQDVPVQISHANDGLLFEGGHDGYLSTHGLTHARILELTFDGRALVGEDMLLALKATEKRRFDKAMDAVRLAGVPFHIRFHLHPDVDCEIDLGGTAVSLALRSGEIWVFRHEGEAEMSLEPSVYLESGRLRPRATKQIVLTHRAMEYATRIRWSLSKAQETAIAVRDLYRDDDYDFDS